MSMTETRTQWETLMHIHTARRILFVLTALLGLIATSASAAPTCPISYGTTDDAKSHKLCRTVASRMNLPLR